MKLSEPFQRPSKRGFTLVETMIGLTMLVLAAGSIFLALSQMNKVASIARLYTAAQFIVQSNINQIQSDGPFILQNGQYPNSLLFIKTGTPSVNNSYPVYVDPATSLTQVTGTLTTSGSAIGTTYAYATVELTYTYRNKTYDFLESTVRASDQQ